MSDETKDTQTLVGEVELFTNIAPTIGEHHRVQGRKPRNAPPNTPPPLVDVIRLRLGEDEDPAEFLATVLGGGSIEEGSKILSAFLLNEIKEAAEEASDEAFEGDTFNPVRFEPEFVSYFNVLESRKRQRISLKERRAELFEEMGHILEQIVATGSISEELQNRFAQIQLELREIEERQAKRAQRRKKPEAVAA